MDVLFLSLVGIDINISMKRSINKKVIVDEVVMIIFFLTEYNHTLKRGGKDLVRYVKEAE